jgi:hypothetical protein
MFLPPSRHRPSDEAYPISIHRPNADSLTRPSTHPTLEMSIHISCGHHVQRPLQELAPLAIVCPWRHLLPDNIDKNFRRFGGITLFRAWDRCKSLGSGVTNVVIAWELVLVIEAITVYSLCAESSRRDVQYADPEWGEFNGERFCQSFRR